MATGQADPASVAQSLRLTTFDTSLVALRIPGVWRSAGTGSGTGDRNSGARLAKE